MHEGEILTPGVRRPSCIAKVWVSDGSSKAYTINIKSLKEAKQFLLNSCNNLDHVTETNRWPRVMSVVPSCFTTYFCHKK